MVDNNMPTYRILFCVSEVYPLIKTGGLADVAGSLPRALNDLKHDVRLVMPAYQSVMTVLKTPPKLCYQTHIDEYPVRILQTTLPDSRVPVWLVDCPPLFDRPGSPYHDTEGKSWADNDRRFALFNRVIVQLANNQFGMDWQPQLVHCHDWQTGLVPALLNKQPQRPATVFTIHNLAYQGLFDRQSFEQLGLPKHLWHDEQLKHDAGFAFIKGGLVNADRINTVSPNYAREIQTPAFGHGMQALLQNRSTHLSGITNGIDDRTWNPGSDKLITQTYNRQQLSKKRINKQTLQQHFKLTQQDDVFVLGLVSRLVKQKGIDMLIDILPQLMAMPLQLVILGSGDKPYEQALLDAAETYKGKMGTQIGFNETLAHQIEAGIDIFLMPSRFEPCGLNQMYSQRYGSLPIVTPVGGLSDTVIDASDKHLADSTATGFVMEDVSQSALLQTIERALQLYQDKTAWLKLQHTAMKADFSWSNSAESYCLLYAQALLDHSQIEQQAGVQYLLNLNSG
jgi:starch synthase